MKTQRKTTILRELGGLDARLRGAEIQVGLMVPGVFEDWRVIGHTGQPGFQNGWGNHGSSEEAAFLRDTSGFIHLRGMVAHPSSAPVGQGTIFTLPSGYRPALAEVHPTVAIVPTVSSLPQHWPLTIFSNGEVKVRDGQWPNASFPDIEYSWLVIDHHTFRAS